MTGCVFLSILSTDFYERLSLISPLVNGTTMRYWVRRKQIVNVDVVKQKMYLGNVQLFLKNIETYKKEAKIQTELSSVDWFVNPFLLKNLTFPPFRNKIDKYVGVPAYNRIINQKTKEIEAMEKDQTEEGFSSEGILQKARNSIFETKEVKSDNEQE